MGLLFDQKVIYVMCIANTIQKLMPSNKDAAPAKKRKQVCSTLCFGSDRLVNQEVSEMFVVKLFGVHVTQMSF